MCQLSKQDKLVERLDKYHLQQGEKFNNIGNFTVNRLDQLFIISDAGKLYMLSVQFHVVDTVDVQQCAPEWCVGR